MDYPRNLTAFSSIEALRLELAGVARRGRILLDSKTRESLLNSDIVGISDSVTEIVHYGISPLEETADAGHLAFSWAQTRETYEYAEYHMFGFDYVFSNDEIEKQNIDNWKTVLTLGDYSRAVFYGEGDFQLKDIGHGKRVFEKR